MKQALIFTNKLLINLTNNKIQQVGRKLNINIFFIIQRITLNIIIFIKKTLKTYLMKKSMQIKHKLGL